MKILHVITGLQTGGAETMLHRLLSHSDCEPAEHRVVCLGRSGAVSQQLKASGIVVDILNGSGRLSAPRVVFTVRRIVRDFQPDIVQGWMYDGNLAAWCAAKGSGAKLAWNVRHSVSDFSLEPYDLQLVIRLSALLSASPDVIIYNSHVSARQHQALGFASERNQILPNGFDTNVFRLDKAARARIRTELGIADDTYLIGKIARYHPMKGHLHFIKAAGKLLRTVPDARFLLAGCGVTRDNKVLAEAARQAGIYSNTYFLGEREDTPALNTALDVAVSSSAWGEGFSNVIGEAMACGVPCVATDVGDAAELVADTGIVIPPGQPQALCEALLKLYRVGHQGRQSLGAKARARVIEKWSLDSVRQQYYALYRKLIS